MEEKFLKNKSLLKKLKKPKGIIFDWDNTLVDTWPLIQSSIDQTMIAMNLEPWGLEKVRNNVHKSMRESFPEIFGNNWQEAGEIYKNSYRSIHLTNLEFLPNALNLINFLHQKKILQFVVSNKIGNTLRKEAQKLEVDRKFFSLIGSQDSNFDKPDKTPVELALLGSQLDLKKDEIWFIGDTIADVDCAYNCGITPIVYAYEKNGFSKTIPEKLMEEKEIALYQNHQHLIDVLSI
jgi:phosphoglycolate phosphatase